MLVNWLRYYYHRVYSLSEDDRPPDDMVEYDLLLDEWLDNKDTQEKIEMKRKGKESFKMV